MSAADPLTDTTGVQVGDPDPWTGDYDMCEARLESAGHLICTALRGHTGPHVAAGASDIIAVDPARPSATDQALAEAWAEGHRTGWEHCQDGNYGNDYWDDPTPNPYAAAGLLATARTETSTGAIARGEALAAGDPDWMNVTRWPRTEAEATTTILRLIEDNRRMRHGSLCPECNAKAWGERADFRRERDELAAKVAAVEALADEWDKSDETHEWILAADLRAALTEVTTDTTKETDR